MSLTCARYLGPKRLDLPFKVPYRSRVILRSQSYSSRTSQLEPVQTANIGNGALKNHPLKLLVNLATIIPVLTAKKPITHLKATVQYNCSTPSVRSSKPSCWPESTTTCTNSVSWMTTSSDSDRAIRLLQLFQSTDHVTTAFNRKQTAAVVSLYLEKAFDKIRHEVLLLKMKDCSFPL
ncbi:hypothetical protein Trydic_g14080 [Trypoxylus dichotomus]